MLENYPRAEKIFQRFESDHRIMELQFLANNFTVNRLGYNDHSRVHAYVVTRNALKIAEVLRRKGIKFNIVKEGLGDYQDVITVISVASFIHDIGNSIHRSRHGMLGAILASPILDDHLSQENKYMLLKTAIMEAIYAHNDDEAISIEASVVKVADGTDMTEGRARLPYEKGVFDIHSISALSINDVEITDGQVRPLRIVVEAEHTAALFQVEMVLGQKIKSSALRGNVEVLMKMSSVGEKLLFF